jgi:hypothetical protein
MKRVKIDKLKKDQDNMVSDKVIDELKDRFTEKELKIIAKGGKLVPGRGKIPIVDFSGKRIRFGVISDLHSGSIYFYREWLDSAIKECKKQRCEFITVSGDITEGMSKRDGHIYELSKRGYKEQRDYAVEILSEWKGKYYMISGNHDLWYYNNSDEGALIVEDVCSQLKNAEYLGEQEGDISLKGLATIKLWHGIDGSCYALSYRGQKIIESLTGGEKPNMMIAGHDHKAFYMANYRNVEFLAAGCMCKQSKFMRGKKLANHSGFWIVDVWVGKSGIGKCSTMWYPFYS